VSIAVVQLLAMFPAGRDIAGSPITVSLTFKNPDSTDCEQLELTPLQSLGFAWLIAPLPASLPRVLQP